MTADLQNPAFQDEDKAREALEAIRWPDGPFCPHCGNSDQAKIAKGEGKAHRPGLYYCAACNGQFTVTVGTVMERSKIPLSKWLMAMHLMGASKKGISALQMQRMLGVTYKTAWFLCHRIREAMKPATPSPLGGEGKIVEADEMAVGGKSKNRAFRKKAIPKQIVVALVERGGGARSFHVGQGKRGRVRDLRPFLVANASRKSRLMTDQDKNFVRIGEEFAGHDTVDHHRAEYARGDVTTNTVEGFFSIFKRGVVGVYHHVSEAHIDRYLAEFDFRYSNRAKLGVTDGERATLIAKGIEGKRLTYRPTH
jgi:transposase-like protein